MAYRINGKNLSIARLMPRGKDSDSRMKYMHASSKGTTVIAPTVVARVSLPPQGDMDGKPTIWPENIVADLVEQSKTHKDFYDEQIAPHGLPAVTGPEYMVPKLDPVFPEPGEQSAVFTVNAEILLKVLKAACEVTTDAEKAVRLRICPERNVLRVDAYRQPGEQEFIAVIQELEYCGMNIPGDKPSDAPPAPEVKPKPTKLGELKVSTGRKFRA